MKKLTAILLTILLLLSASVVFAEENSGGDSFLGLTINSDETANEDGENFEPQNDLTQPGEIIADEDSSDTQTDIPENISSDAAEIIIIYKDAKPTRTHTKHSERRVRKFGKISNSVDTAIVAKGEFNAAISELNADPEVYFAGTAPATMQVCALPNDTYVQNDYQWWFGAVGADKTWNNFSAVPQVGVAVIDTGVLTTHDDLAGRTIQGYDYVANNTSVTDVAGHGTSVAGVIAATADNNKGIAGVAGTANIKIAPYRVGGTHAGDTALTTKHIIAALVDISGRSDIKVINMSFGGYLGDSRTLYTESYLNTRFDTLWAAIKLCRDKGKILVAAAGNSGTSGDGYYFYPASYPGVISVASVDKDNIIATTSQRNNRVDIAAPGVSIITTKMDGQYFYTSGTSLASPIVAGAAAVMLARHPSITRSQVTAALKKTSTPLGQQYTGSGLLNLDNMLKYILVYVSKVTFSGLSATKYTGQKITIKATVSPSTATAPSLIWSSSDNTIATVDQSGNVEFLLVPGKVTVRADTVDGSRKYASYTFTVKQKVTGLSLSIGGNPVPIFDEDSGIEIPTVVARTKRVTIKPTATPSNATLKTVTWKSSNTRIATVSTSGVVTGRSVGEVVITAKAKDGSGVTASCKVKVIAKVSSISFGRVNQTLWVGEKRTIPVTVRPTNAEDKTLIWSSSNTNVATVDSGTGEITAVAGGTTYIKATSTDGSNRYNRILFTVKQFVGSIVLNYTENSDLAVGRTLQLKTNSVLPSTATNKAVTWTTSNSSIATVSSNGLVTRKASGEFTIYATAKDGSGIKASCVFTSTDGFTPPEL